MAFRYYFCELIDVFFFNVYFLGEKVDNAQKILLLNLSFLESNFDGGNFLFAREAAFSYFGHSFDMVGEPL